MLDMQYCATSTRSASARTSSDPEPNMMLMLHAILSSDCWPLRICGSLPLHITQSSQYLEVPTRGILVVIASNTRMEYPSNYIYTQQDSRGIEGGETIHGFAVVDKNPPATFWVADPSRRHRLSTDPLCARRAARTHRRSGIGICLMVAIDLDFSILE